jgi:DNA-binding MarR family transcriptional regulator
VRARNCCKGAGILRKVTTSRRIAPDDDLAALMTAGRIFMHLASSALAQAGDAVTPQQWRVLVLAGTQPGLNVSAVATDLDIHPSNATRIVDRLVEAGLLSRTASTADRRHVELALAPAGRGLMAQVMRHREVALQRLLDRVPEGDRPALTRSLLALAEAGGEPPRMAAWPEIPRRLS